jgi:hypothetical protein
MVWDEWEAWADDLKGLTLVQLEDQTPSKVSASSLELGRAEPVASLRVGAHVHLHYLEPWPEIALHLRRLPEGSRIFITVSEEIGRAHV